MASNQTYTFRKVCSRLTLHLLSAELCSGPICEETNTLLDVETLRLFHHHIPTTNDAAIASISLWLLELFRQQEQHYAKHELFARGSITLKFPVQVATSTYLDKHVLWKRLGSVRVLVLSRYLLT